VLEQLVCPVCGKDFELRGDDERGGDDAHSGALSCTSGHTFPIVDGVPRLLLESRLESGDARSIRESFSRQWEHFDYEAEDKTWGQTLESRLDDFLRMVDLRPEELKGKLILDAGCGNGLLSDAITRFGCHVLAADISSSVAVAHRHFGSNPHVDFVQADLMAPPFRPGAFDIVFCAGVLIVTPDSRTTFDHVARAVSPGGRLFVWVYWREPKLLYRVKVLLRRLLAPMPLPARRAAAYAFVPQALLRQWLRRRRRPEQEGQDLNWREHFVVQHDFFTPRYRWEHTPEEVFAWFREAGFTDMKTTEVVPAGFGVLGRLPNRVDTGDIAHPTQQPTRA
jgi:2-polyprenyl-3-methyl-5-hydroxy-6-metoxy-1,4-benzoquinol methylase/uncharacterized protein YbaR (Trm112 family)